MKEESGEMKIKRVEIDELEEAGYFNSNDEPDGCDLLRIEKLAYLGSSDFMNHGYNSDYQELESVLAHVWAYSGDRRFLQYNLGKKYKELMHTLLKVLSLRSDDASIELSLLISNLE